MPIPSITYLLDADDLALQGQVSASSANTQYPASNLLTDEIAEQWRSAEGATSAVEIYIDFAFANSLDIIALVGHNLSSTATISLFGGTAPHPDGTDFSQSVTYQARTAWESFTATSRKHWTVQITDEANIYGYLSVGRLLVGAATSFSFGFSPQWGLIRGSHTRRAQNEFMAPMVGRRLAKWSELRFSIPTLSEAERVTFEGVLDDLDGVSKAALLIPVSTEPQAYYGRMNAELYSIERATGNIAAGDINFKEDSHGVIVSDSPTFAYEP